MHQSNRELWISFIAILIITGLYLVVVIFIQQVPAASDFFGHSLGILGFILMLATETLYSLRKRSRSARWGEMSAWLQFHIFTGLVGPYMVLLHSSWKFNGLAGIVLLLTVVIVTSGFIGRYIYTALPRGVNGTEIEVELLEQEIKEANVVLTRWLSERPEATRALAQRLSASPTPDQSAMRTLFGRSFMDLGSRIQWILARMRMDPVNRAQTRRLEMLLRRQNTLQRQLASLALARRLLGLWHTFHIPLGLSLFIAAFIHIVAAVYYATLLR